MILPADACWTRVAWLVRVILRCGRKHASVCSESFLRDIPRGTPLESLGNRDIACKTARYIILRPSPLCAPQHMCDGEARNETRPSRCILPTVRAIIADPLFHYARALVTHVFRVC